MFFAVSQADDKRTECPEPFRRKIRSFVKRDGRTSKRQSQAFEKMLPEYGIDFSEQALNLSSLFKRQAPIVLEIGFGMGDSLAQMAVDHPEYNYIGIEVHKPGVGSLLATIEENHINNIRVFNHDAVEVLEHSIPDQSLDRAQIFFPDPWPKKRHHKRRLIQAVFVTLLAQKLKAGGILHIATDWENYAEWIKEIMDKRTDFNRLPKGTNHQRPMTKFEKRGLNLGHGVWDLLYSRSD